MRVCVLQHVFDPYKGANHLSLFAAEANIAFTVICSVCKISQAALPPNVQVIVVPGWTGPYYYGCMDMRFARIILALHPPADPFWRSFDVVHCNQVMGPDLRRLRETGVPVLFFIHHPVTADLEVALQESRGYRKLLWRMKYTLLICWQRALCQTVDHIATVSESMRKRIADDYHCDLDKISIVPNGIDGEKFTPDPSPPLFDIIAIGSFIHPRKGFRYLVDAYRVLVTQGFKIADVGRRSDSQLAILRSISGVTVYGTVDQKTVLTLLQKSSVLISTSLYEGFGLSLIEALACGRPAFAFGGGAVPEVLASIDPSLVVSLRDTRALVGRVEDFLHLPDAQRRHRGEKYRNAVIDRYRIDLSAKQLMVLYRKMLKKH